MEKTIEQEAYNYFYEVLQIPRGSGNEKAISDHLVAFAEENHLEHMQDESLNVVIRKQGSEGRQNEPPVILQAHMDIVCEKNEEFKHDFLTDPIIPVIDGDWVRASGTTLGADNGSGVAYIMAVLAATDISHPPIEAVITTGEETVCAGAAAFNAAVLKGKRLLNLDGEKEGNFIVSCAGATVITVKISVDHETVPETFSAYKLMLKGLTGGHSGCDIDKGGGNANILMATLLDRLYNEDIRLFNINNGGKMNAIPRECSAVISFDENHLETIKMILAHTESEFRVHHPFDIDLRLSLEKSGVSGKAMSNAALEKLIKTMLHMPNGVYSLSSRIEGLVQTSNNLGVITTDENTITMTNLLRSSSIAEMEIVIEKFNQLADRPGINVEVFRSFPAWEYMDDSPLRNTLKAVYREMYGKEPVITSVHAGVECALFAQKIPGADIASIDGPDIVGMHSPNEKMSIPSFNRTCRFLVRVLEKL